VGVTAALLLAAALGSLITDEVSAGNHDDRARTSLGITRQRTLVVSAQLRGLQRDLSDLKTQVGSDTTALDQDASQLSGAQTSLAEAQAHVGQQSSLATLLQNCLAGVEEALNELAVGQQGAAITALNSVSESCTAAEAASG
jgi:hypothetical protein